MDLKVYKKEAVRQPSGTEYVISPNIIDIYPEIVTDDDNIDVLVNAEIVEDNEEIEQACALATIWQKGLDPIEPDYGVRWSEALLEEINITQLMEDITNAVAMITPDVTVVFDTTTDENGYTFLKYTLKAVA